MRSERFSVCSGVSANVEPMGTQSLNCAFGNWKSAGMTPTIVCGRPLKTIVRPIAPGSPPKRRLQKS
jgi:hypothetical protein